MRPAARRLSRVGRGKELNPKTIILQTQRALLDGARETKLVRCTRRQVLWQCTTCGACENQCPVGIEHLPILIGSRRGLVRTATRPRISARCTQPERPQQYLGLGYDQRTKFVQSAGVETFDPAKHDVLVWLGWPARSMPTFRSPSGRLFGILARKT